MPRAGGTGKQVYPEELNRRAENLGALPQTPQGFPALDPGCHRISCDGRYINLGLRKTQFSAIKFFVPLSVKESGWETEGKALKVLIKKEGALTQMRMGSFR